MEKRQERPAGQKTGWVSALIDESQVAAWATLGRLYAAMWHELVEGGVCRSTWLWPSLRRTSSR